MSTAKEIRDRLLRSFRAELAEHIQTMTAGLLSVEQATAAGGALDQEVLHTTYRAAHSLKGAARAMGVTAVEQIAHAQETILDSLRRGVVTPSTAMFSAFYQSMDAIQAVQAAYEAGETTPPAQALIALMELEKIRSTALPPASQPEPATVAPVAIPLEPKLSPAVQKAAYATGDETIRVDVEKLDAMMANLNDLLIARITLEERLGQLIRLRDQINGMQRAWSQMRMPFNRLERQVDGGLLSLHKPISVDAYEPRSNGSTVQQMQQNAGAARAGNQAEYEGEELKRMVEVCKDVDSLLQYLRTSQEQMGAVAGQIETLSRHLAADSAHISLIIDSMEEDVKRLRLMPFNAITTTFARMVRDLANQEGKEAALTILGGDTEMDKRVLEAMKDPLMHLIRNAVGHGIEPPEQRQAAGKSRTGQITISAERAGNEIIVRVSDDGAGLDVESIRKALAKTVSSKGETIDPDAMSENELIESIFSLGISTSPMITDVSGRGVGLNVVRSNVESLHGRLTVSYQQGMGSTFSLFMPLSLTGMLGLLVRAAGQTLAIPIDSIERTLKLEPEDLFVFEGHDAIDYDGRPLPLACLSETLEIHTHAQEAVVPLKESYVVVLSIKERFDQHGQKDEKAGCVAFVVDQLLGEQEIVIKDLGSPLAHVVGFAGATILGNGEVVLVLNTDELVKMASRQGRRTILDAVQTHSDEKAQKGPKKILVVDDSITTRTLEKNILEAAGYQVCIATDGCEALEMMQAGSLPDLVVTDIVMPRMDGFEMTHRIKSDPQTAHLPVILVTSLESAEDKKRGIEVQADAYIVKSGFDQANLLGTIEQLI